MRKQLLQAFISWPKSFISTTDLASITGKSDPALYAFVNRALKDESLVHISRGLFLIPSMYNKRVVDCFELAQVIYGPSFISCESALSHHGLIPETVYTITSVTTKRSRDVSTPLGIFSYKKIPKDHFLVGVERVVRESGIFFVARFWRAIADLIFIAHKEWVSLKTMCEDLRIESIPTSEEDHVVLRTLASSYPNTRTQRILKRLLEQIDEHPNYSR